MQIKISNDKELVERIRRKIKENGGYCICSLVKSEDTRCMCKKFLEQQTSGKCHCGLYEKTVD